MINSKQFFSIVLTISFLISTIFGTIPVMADEPDGISTIPIIDESFKIPDIIDGDEAKNYIGRLKEDENDLYTFVFVNEDGSNTMRVFGHPVKYTEDDGTIKDISLSLKKLDNGSFTSTNHMIDVTFNPELKDGISLNYKNVSILMKCSDKTYRSSISKDAKTLTYTIDKNTSYIYNLTYTGVKENIVVNEYTGDTDYDFSIITNGLHPIRKDGLVYLADKTNNIKVQVKYNQLLLN